VLGVISTSRDVVEASFAGLCDELTSVGWLVMPVLLAADEWRADWTHHHHRHVQHDQDYKKHF